MHGAGHELPSRRLASLSPQRRAPVVEIRDKKLFQALSSSGILQRTGRPMAEVCVNGAQRILVMLSGLLWGFFCSNLFPALVHLLQSWDLEFNQTKVLPSQLLKQRFQPLGRTLKQKQDTLKRSPGVLSSSYPCPKRRAWGRYVFELIFHWWLKTNQEILIGYYKSAGMASIRDAILAHPAARFVLGPLSITTLPNSKWGKTHFKGCCEVCLFIFWIYAPFFPRVFHKPTRGSFH